jgi:hypothetical protein
VPIAGALRRHFDDRLLLDLQARAMKITVARVKELRDAARATPFGPVTLTGREVLELLRTIGRAELVEDLFDGALTELKREGHTGIADRLEAALTSAYPSP